MNEVVVSNLTLSSSFLAVEILLTPLCEVRLLPQSLPIQFLHFAFIDLLVLGPLDLVLCWLVNLEIQADSVDFRGGIEFVHLRDFADIRRMEIRALTRVLRDLLKERLAASSIRTL